MSPNPIKLTPAQFKRMQRNLNPSDIHSSKGDEVLVSLLHRMFWHLYAAITGKTYSLHEIHNDARIKLIRDQFVKTFLDELRRKIRK